MTNSVVGPGQVIADRYRIEQLLGQGGMGSVYRAVQLSVQRTVALKRLVDEHLDSASHVERFEREAIALSRLVHPSTVRLFDFGTDDRGCPFIVMEYLQGADLAHDLGRHGPMRWDHALLVSRQVLGSLAEAHDAGIVHRDIKPANLFLCAGPRWPVVKVLDFGIAGSAERDDAAPKLTLTGTVLGSAAYMSPEQAQGLSAGPAADLYSFGVVLFEMLTGTTPFDGRTLTAQLLAKVLAAAPALHERCPELDVPAEVRALVAELLDRDPMKRPASARATAERIEAVLGRASLPPLSRSEQRPARHFESGLARTEVMPLPRTIDEGWSPPKTHAHPCARPGRARGVLRWALAVAAAGAVAGAAASSFDARPPELQAPVAALASLATSVDGVASEPDSTELGVAAPPEFDPSAPQGSAPHAESASAPHAESASALPSPAPPPPSAVGSRSDVAEPGREPRVASGQLPARQRRPSPRRSAPTTGTRPVGLSGARSTAATSARAGTRAEGRPPPATPDTLVPSVSRPSVATAAPSSSLPDALAPMPASGPSPPAPSDPPVAASSAARAPAPAEPRAAAPERRRWTVAAAIAAEESGELTPAQRNRIINVLRRRRFDARARVARAYREGRISHAELEDRQAAIDREFEGR